MFALVVLWSFTTPSFYQGAVLLKGRAALILSKLEIETDPQKIADNAKKVETLKHKAKEKQCRNGNFANCGGYQGFQLQFTFTAGWPTQLQDNKEQNVDPILFFGISFVVDKHGGFQIYTLRRDIKFSPTYTPGVAESAYPSEYAGASISAAVGTIGGTDFAVNGTTAYKGPVVDYVLGSVDHYEMVDKTGRADLTRLYGDDVALLSVGSPNGGQLATYAEPLFNMPRIGPPIRDPYDY